MNTHGREITSDYSIRAVGPYVGKLCTVGGSYKMSEGVCKHSGRWLIQPYDTANREILACGQHLSVAIKSLAAISDKAIVVQEVPLGKIRT